MRMTFLNTKEKNVVASVRIASKTEKIKKDEKMLKFKSNASK